MSGQAERRRLSAGRETRNAPAIKRFMEDHLNEVELSSFKLDAWSSSLPGTLLDTVFRTEEFRHRKTVDTGEKRVGFPRCRAEPG